MLLCTLNLSYKLLAYCLTPLDGGNYTSCDSEAPTMDGNQGHSWEIILTNVGHPITGSSQDIKDLSLFCVHCF